MARLLGATPTVAGEAATLPDDAASEQVASDFRYHAVWTANHLRL